MPLLLHTSVARTSSPPETIPIFLVVYCSPICLLLALWRRSNDCEVYLPDGIQITSLETVKVGIAVEEGSHSNLVSQCTAYSREGLHFG